ncbi:hypothetical protein CLF_101338 [Clonorchis sinensis]|uniref:Uncharacterized protein n=1 Tax=Clonorchis sinensis TaxID=79923 RepID=G7Y5I9_CLOSI|nr:hypothetical protein CLF_101338 [Clonorchis sinensis]
MPGRVMHQSYLTVKVTYKDDPESHRFGNAPGQTLRCYTCSSMFFNVSTCCIVDGRLLVTPALNPPDYALNSPDLVERSGGGINDLLEKPFICNTLLMPTCHVSREKHEGYFDQQLLDFHKPKKSILRAKGAHKDSSSQENGEDMRNMASFADIRSASSTRHNVLLSSNWMPQNEASVGLRSVDNRRRNVLFLDQVERNNRPSMMEQPISRSQASSPASSSNTYASYPTSYQPSPLFPKRDIGNCDIELVSRAPLSPAESDNTNDTYASPRLKRWLRMSSFNQRWKQKYLDFHYANDTVDESENELPGLETLRKYPQVVSNPSQSNLARLDSSPGRTNHYSGVEPTNLQSGDSKCPVVRRPVRPQIVETQVGRITPIELDHRYFRVTSLSHLDEMEFSQREVRLLKHEDSNASNVRWWSSGNTLAWHADVRGLNPGAVTGYVLLMSSNKSETRVQCFPLVRTHRGLSVLAVYQSSCFLRVAWQLGTERVLELNDFFEEKQSEMPLCGLVGPGPLTLLKHSFIARLVRLSRTCESLTLAPFLVYDGLKTIFPKSIAPSENGTLQAMSKSLQDVSQTETDSTETLRPQEFRKTPTYESTISSAIHNLRFSPSIQPNCDVYGISPDSQKASSQVSSSHSTQAPRSSNTPVNPWSSNRGLNDLLFTESKNSSTLNNSFSSPRRNTTKIVYAPGALKSEGQIGRERTEEREWQSSGLLLSDNYQRSYKPSSIICTVNRSVSKDIIIIIVDSTTSVFNTDALLSYNHDLFEGLIVKKRIKVDGEMDLMLAYFNRSKEPTPSDTHSGNMDRN